MSATTEKAGPAGSPGSPQPRSDSFYRGVQAGYDPRLLKSGVEIDPQQYRPEPEPQPQQQQQPPAPQLPPRTREQYGYNYKPTPLKWWFLTVLVAFLLVLISLTELSIRSLPASGGTDDLGSLAHSLFQTGTPSLVPRGAKATTKAAHHAATTNHTVAKTSSKKTAKETAKTTLVTSSRHTTESGKSAPESTKQPEKAAGTTSALESHPAPTSSGTGHTTEADKAQGGAKASSTAPEPKPTKGSGDKSPSAPDTPPKDGAIAAPGDKPPPDPPKDGAVAAPKDEPGDPPKDGAVAAPGDKSPPSPDSPPKDGAAADKPDEPPKDGVVAAPGDKSPPPPDTPPKDGAAAPGGNAPGPADGPKDAPPDGKAAAPNDGKAAPPDGGPAAVAGGGKDAPPEGGKPGAGGGKAAPPAADQPPAAGEVVATPTKISLCLTCTAAPNAKPPTAPAGHPTLGPVTSTLQVATVDKDGTPATVSKVVTYPAAKAPAPTTSMVEQVHQVPASTVVHQLVTSDAAGDAVTQAVTSAVPAHAVTTHSAVVLYPGESYATTTGLVTSHLREQTVATRTKVYTDASGKLVTSVYVVTMDPSGATVFSTAYGTVVGNRFPLPTGGVSPGSGDGTDPEDGAVVVMGISRGQYLAGSVLPTFFAVLALIPLRAIDANARLFQPFAALTAAGPDGAPADASVFLRFYGLAGLAAFPRAVRLRQYVVVASQVLLALALLLAPVAAEAVRVHVVDGCPPGSCYGSLGVGMGPGRVLQVLMALMIAGLVGLMVLLARFRTGVRHNPWSVAGIAALGLDPDVRALLRSVPPGLGRKVADWEVWDAVSRGRFLLGTGGRDGRYGIKVLSSPVTRVETLLRPPPPDQRPDANVHETTLAGRKRLMPFALLSWWGRGLLLAFFGIIAVVVIAYESGSGDSGFRRFMNNQDFGVRFFFAGLGVALSLCMGSFFQFIALLSPYRLLSHSPRPGDRSILVSPPTNPLSGLYAAYRQRSPYLGFLAAVSLLADFLPLTLSHVPFSVIETREAQAGCAWLSVVILVLMMAAVAGSFAIAWPHMPVDPRTVAGALYYVCDSWMLGSMDGLAGSKRADRDWMVSANGLRYMYGYMTGREDKERIGIDGVEEPEMRETKA